MSDKDAIAYFNKTYVATDIFSRELGKRLGRIKMVRGKVIIAISMLRQKKRR